mmetsp:Transcript_1180/g.2464  ORF Transcript_1180/g.2464 Transcript_1180/m.2464 type:complete len:363 (-) Transcript_1180:222-1310(-)
MINRSFLLCCSSNLPNAALSFERRAWRRGGAMEMPPGARTPPEAASMPKRWNFAEAAPSSVSAARSFARLRCGWFRATATSNGPKTVASAATAAFALSAAATSSPAPSGVAKTSTEASPPLSAGAPKRAKLGLPAGPKATIAPVAVPPGTSAAMAGRAQRTRPPSASAETVKIGATVRGDAPATPPAPRSGLKLHNATTEAPEPITVVRAFCDAAGDAAVATKCAMSIRSWLESTKAAESAPFALAPPWPSPPGEATKTSSCAAPSAQSARVRWPMLTTSKHNAELAGAANRACNRGPSTPAAPLSGNCQSFREAPALAPAARSHSDPTASCVTPGLPTPPTRIERRVVPSLMPSSRTSGIP